MIKVIIIEDEKPSARRLQRMLSQIGIEAQAMLHSVSEAIAWFEANDHPDLILLDIQLSDGLSFEIFERVEVKSAIIFTTAYDEYALQAFKLNSIDYLLKPIDTKELSLSVKKYSERLSQQQAVTLNINDIKKLLVNSSDISHLQISMKLIIDATTNHAPIIPSTRARGPHRGAVTHHHDHPMCPNSFSTRNTMNTQPQRPIPPLLLSLFESDIFFLSFSECSIFI